MMYKYLSFVAWIFKKMFAGVFEFNDRWRELLRYETPVALFGWLVFSFLSSIAVLLIMAAVDSWVTPVSIKVLFVWIGVCVGYLVYSSFSLMWQAFNEERNQLFETIRRGQ